MSKSKMDISKIHIANLNVLEHALRSTSLIVVYTLSLILQTVNKIK